MSSWPQNIRNNKSPLQMPSVLPDDFSGPFTRAIVSGWLQSDIRCWCLENLRATRRVHGGDENEFIKV